MKNLWLFILLISFATTGFSQSDTTKINFGKYKIILIDDENGNNDDIQIEKREENEIDEREENEIDEREENEEDVESEETIDNRIEVEEDEHDNDNDDDDDDDDDDHNKRGRNSFKTRANWGGLSFGIHQLISDPSNASGSDDFLDLESGTSWAYEFLSFSFPLGSPYISFSTGLGYRRDKYYLSKDIRIESDETNVWGEQVVDEVSLNKNVVKNYYMEVPLMFNFSTSTRKKSNIRFSLGYIQQIGIKTRAEYEYSKNGAEHEELVKSGYNFRRYNGSVTARIGYRALTFYGNYGLSSIFKSDKGPILNPITIGLSLRILPVIRYHKKHRT